MAEVEDCRRRVVGGLSWNTRERDLEDAFQRYGRIVKAKGIGDDSVAVNAVDDRSRTNPSSSLQTDIAKNSGVRLGKAVDGKVMDFSVGHEQKQDYEEDGDDEDCDDSESEASDEEYHGAGLSSAFGRAFGKIMKKPVSTDASMGPLLAARKHLIAKKLEEEASNQQAKSESKKEKRALREVGHVLPQSYTDTKEVQLIRLATKGVVTLFNAVNKAQRVQANVVGSSGRTAKVAVKHSKAAFLAELRGLPASANGTKASYSEAGLRSRENEDKGKPGWTVLHDNFMLGRSKLKEWDKKTNVGNNPFASPTGVHSDASSPDESDKDSE